MRLLEGPHGSWAAPSRPSAVTIGVYDGMHRGHQHLIRSLGHHARRENLALTVVTFRDHPAVVLAPDRVPRRLTSFDQQLEWFERLGVDQVAVLDFDDHLRHLAPDAFVRQVLVDGLDVALVSVGEDFRFGFQQRGDVDMLRRLGDELGFAVLPIGLVGDGAPVRATEVRRALADGDLAAVEHALGRRFSLRGEVVRGEGRGRAIGFPTANLALAPRQAVPKRGVYAVRVGTGGSTERGVANVGVRPTFDGTEEVVEVHLLDADPDLYGQELSVEFVARIRDERRFDGVEALAAQIGRDADRAAEILG